MANQKSYEEWKSKKQAQKEEDARKRKIKREQEQEANIKMLKDLQSRLKENVQRRNKTEFDVPKIPTPPPQDVEETPGGRFERSYMMKNHVARKKPKNNVKKKQKVENARYSPRADMERFFSKAPKGAVGMFEGLTVIGKGGTAR